jgi:hypothetical protein
MKKVLNNNLPHHIANNDEKYIPQEYPVYPDSEDIYRKFKKEKNMDPEDILKVKKSSRNDKAGKDIEKKFDVDGYGSDLDIPGSELDDNQEKVGSEDEENNFYSIGGEDHNNLDEDRDELW